MKSLKFCPDCGRSLTRSDANFCDDCGSPLRPGQDRDVVGPYEFGVVRDPELAGAVWDALGVPASERRTISHRDMKQLSEPLIITCFARAVDLEGIQHATGLTRLTLQGIGPWNLQPLAGLFRLVELALHGLDGSDLRPLADLVNLSSLELMRPRERDWDQLTQLANLRHLSLSDVPDLSAVAQLSSLISLAVDRSTGANDLGSVATLTGLRSLTIKFDHAESPVDLEPLRGLTALTDLALEGSVYGEATAVPTLEQLTSLGELRSLYVMGFGVVNDLEPLADLTKLATLYLRGLPQVRDLEPLADLTSLTTLRLWGAMPVRDLGPLRGLRGLTTLDLYELTGVYDIATVGSLTGLTTLKLQVLPIEDLDPLATLGNLRDLTICGGYTVPTNVSSLEPLSGLSSLATLWLGRLPVSDIRPLASLRSLSDLTLWKMPVSDLTPLSVVPDLTIHDKRWD